MLGSIIFHSPSTVLFESNGIDLSRSTRSRGVVCNAQRSNDSIPKLDPFSRNSLDRWVPKLPFLQKCENDLADYCCTLEGDESHSCWKAYFELKDLEKEMPKEDLEQFLRTAGGGKTLISCLHVLTAMEKKAKQKPAQKMQQPIPLNTEEERHRPFPVPDGLPKTQEELEEEERARMPDSPYTRLLRTIGGYPSWYIERPDHETD